MAKSARIRKKQAKRASIELTTVSNKSRRRSMSESKRKGLVNKPALPERPKRKSKNIITFDIDTLDIQIEEKPRRPYEPKSKSKKARTRKKQAKQKGIDLIQEKTKTRRRSMSESKRKGQAAAPTIKEPKTIEVVDFDLTELTSSIKSIKPEYYEPLELTEETFKAKEFLNDMISNRMDGVDKKLIDEVQELIYEATDEELDRLADMFGNGWEGWKEFYEHNYEYQAGANTVAEKEGILTEIIDYLG